MISRPILQSGISFLRPCAISPKRFVSNLYEPDYLASMEPDIPIYESLNIQIKGYDYPILENYQRYVHKMAKCLNIEVDECWATPAQKLKVQRFKPVSTIVETEFNLSIYERNVQICDVPSTSFCVLLRAIQEALPEGVSLQVHESLDEHQDIRYVPDTELLSLKQQLDDIAEAKEKKKTKK